MTKWNYEEEDVDFHPGDTHAFVYRKLHLGDELFSAFHKLATSLEGMMEGMSNVHINESELFVSRISPRHKPRWGIAIQIVGYRKLTKKELVVSKSELSAYASSYVDSDRVKLLAIKARNPGLFKEVMGNG